MLVKKIKIKNNYYDYLKEEADEEYLYRWRNNSSVHKGFKSYLLEKAEVDEDFKKMLQRVTVSYKITELDENDEEFSYILLSN